MVEQALGRLLGAQPTSLPFQSHTYFSQSGSGGLGGHGPVWKVTSNVGRDYLRKMAFLSPLSGLTKSQAGPCSHPLHPSPRPVVQLELQEREEEAGKGGRVLSRASDWKEEGRREEPTGPIKQLLLLRLLAVSSSAEHAVC